MAYIRRYRGMFTLYTLILLICVVAWISPTLLSINMVGEARAQTTQEPQPLDPYVYTQISALREKMALTNRDLAAMGCTEESATLLLESLKSWYLTNASALSELDRNELRIRASLRNAARGNTELGGAAITQQHQELAATHEQRKVLRESLMTRVAALLNPDQLLIWNSARANIGLPDSIRYVPNLTEQQRVAIRKQLMNRSADVSLKDVLASELTWNQKQALDVIQTISESTLSSVRAAEVFLLPLPKILIRNDAPSAQP